MKIGTISYNIHCNFTNYGSALQTWALNQIIKKLNYDPVLIDYCPDILLNKNPLNPYKNMWDTDETSLKMVQLSMPAIISNYYKFEEFYTKQFVRSSPFTSNNFDKTKEIVDGYVCGSDTIFCPDEFGIDDGYYANYNCMQKKSIAYAASFGDPHFNETTLPILNNRLNNFKAIGLRENNMLDYVKTHTQVPVQKVLDPTLLLESSDYEKICSKNSITEKYLLLYSRRYNKSMETFAEQLAKENNWKIIEISLRATNAKKGHIMRYDAGVEEFLSLVKNAQYIVTNSFHGMIFSVQFKRPFVIFSREQCGTKITELLELFGLRNRQLIDQNESFLENIDYSEVHNRIAMEKNKSIAFLKNSLGLLNKE